MAARRFTGKHPESDWPSIARDALEAGLDGPALRRLASYEQKLHWAVAKYSEPALSENGRFQDVPKGSTSLVCQRCQS